MLLNTPTKKITAIFVFFIFTALISYLLLDQYIAKLIHAYFSKKTLRIFDLITYPLEPVLIPMYILLCLKIYEHRSKLKAVLLNFGMATLSTITIISALKLLIHRARPYYGLAENSFDSTSLVSMPSGHAGSAGLITAILWILCKKKSKSLFLIPIIIIVFRILCLKHYLSDIIVGFGVGYCSTLFFHLYDRTFLDKIRDKLWENGKIG